MRVERALIANGYTKCDELGDSSPPPMHFAREVQLKLKGCSNLDANKSYCRVDFVVTPAHGVPIFLEIDEGQHFERPTACEASRMTDVHAALTLGGITFTSLTWVRYNPHCFVDESYRIVNGPAPSVRLQWLLEFIENPRHAFAQGLRVLYCFYDRARLDGRIVPARCLEFDYDKSLRAYSFDAHDEPWHAPRSISDEVAEDTLADIDEVILEREARDRARLRAMMTRNHKAPALSDADPVL
jgi:hypothetical protein